MKDRRGIEITAGAEVLVMTKYFLVDSPFSWETDNRVQKAIIGTDDDKAAAPKDMLAAAYYWDDLVPVWADYFMSERDELFDPADDSPSTQYRWRRSCHLYEPSRLWIVGKDMVG